MVAVTDEEGKALAERLSETELRLQIAEELLRQIVASPDDPRLTDVARRILARRVALRGEFRIDDSGETP